MAPSNPGRRKVREYLPPLLREALDVTRLANADHVFQGGSGMRYIVTGPIHEARDPFLPIQILDSVDGSLIDVPVLLLRLPERLRKPFLYS